jgi:DNA-directed RNA polymerase subunit RPC12/RpoP
MTRDEPMRYYDDAPRTCDECGSKYFSYKIAAGRVICSFCAKESPPHEQYDMPPPWKCPTCGARILAGTRERLIEMRLRHRC